MQRLISIFAVLIWVTCSSDANTVNWLNWRGPTYNGVSKGNGIPLTKELGWRTALPGSGLSTPIVIKDKIFLTSLSQNGTETLAIGLKLKDGTKLWEHKLGSGTEYLRKSITAAPSPVSDGQNIYFLTATGNLAAFNLDGKLLWERDLSKDYGKFIDKFGYASSPLLKDNKLIVALLREEKHGKSHLIALDLKEGKTLWEIVRPTEAIKESPRSYSTPLPMKYQNKDGVLLAGGDCLTWHSLDNGKEGWRQMITKKKYGNWRQVATPCIQGDTIFYPLPRGKTLRAYQVLSDGGAIKELWEYKGSIPDACTPIVHDDTLYVLDGRKKVLSCFNATDGNVLWEDKLETEAYLYASPILAGGKIVCITEIGEVFIYQAERTKNRIAHYNLEEEDFFSTPVVLENGMLLRSKEALLYLTAQ